MARPTKYKKKLANELLEYFNIEPTHTKIVTITTKSGSIIEKEEEAPNRLPTVERWCANNNIHKDTFYEWVDRYSEFSDAYKSCKDLRKDILITNGLLGTYKEGFAKFIAINCTDLRDKIEIKQEIAPDMEEINERLSDMLKEFESR